MGRVTLSVCIFLFAIWYPSHTYAQRTIQGVVLDSLSGQGVWAQVSLHTPADSVLVFSSSDAEGHFKIEVSYHGTLLLRLRALNYEDKQISLNLPESVQVIELPPVLLTPKMFSLEEVIVEEATIEEKGDTIVFDAESFTTGHEEVVADLLKRIPGLSIDGNGIIRLGNRIVEKVMVEGDDFFGNNYQMLTNTMPSAPVGQVEVIQNYMENPLLRGVSKDEKVALNLRLKEKAKSVWFGDLALKGGSSDRLNYEGQFHLMNFGKATKVYSLANGYNTGKKPFIDPERLWQQAASRPSFADLGAPGALYLPVKKYANDGGGFLPDAWLRRNKAATVSPNVITHLGDKVRLQTGIAANIETFSYAQSRRDSFFTPSGAFVNEEIWHHNTALQQGAAFLALFVTPNDKQNATFSLKGQWQSAKEKNIRNWNGLPVNSPLYERQQQWHARLDYTYKIAERHVVQLNGYYNLQEGGQSYEVDPLFYGTFLFPGDSVLFAFQRTSVNRKSGNTSVKYLSRSAGGHLWEYSIMHSFMQETFNNRLKGGSSKEYSSEWNESFQNNVSATMGRLQWAVQRRWQWTHWHLITRTDLDYQKNTLQFSGELQAYDLWRLSPAVGFEYRGSNRHHIRGAYAYRWQEPTPGDWLPSFVLTDYRTLLKGTGAFFWQPYSVFQLQYRWVSKDNKRRVEWDNQYKIQNRTPSRDLSLNPYYTQMVLFVAPSQRGQSSLTYQHYHSRLQGNWKIGGRVARSSFHDIVNGQARSPVLNYWMLNSEWGSVWLGAFNFDIGAKYECSQYSGMATVAAPVKRWSWYADLYWQAASWQLTASLEYLRFLFSGNAASYYMGKVEYKHKLGKSWKLSVSLYNLFNHHSFEQITASANGVSMQSYMARPRMLLIGIQCNLGRNRGMKN